MKLVILYVGKPRDSHLNAFADEFVKRTSRYASIEMRELDPRKATPFSLFPSARHIGLDPAGKMQDSHALSRLVDDAQQSARDLVFTIGGHDGLVPDWRDRMDLLLSLSPMTFPHELARAILAEQLYRALTILKGHPYPR